MRPTGPRPTSVAGMLEALSFMGSEEGVAKGKAFKPSHSDVIISPFAKSGTTWLQQMVHALRTRGDMTFREISEVVPWLELAHDQGLDIEGPQPWTPRAFKSHLPWDEVPKGGRYICSFRDPKDVIISFYHFMEGWFFETGTISVREFAEEYYLAREPQRTYWHHLAAWWRQRDNPDVLLLSFEEMKVNLAETVRRVAAFIELELDDELFEVAVRHSSYEFMKTHEDQFTDVLMREMSEKYSGLPSGSDSSKVVTGKTNSHKQELPEDIGARLDEIWEHEIGQRFGLETYADLQALLEY